jgi:hypothetical protein
MPTYSTAQGTVYLTGAHAADEAATRSVNDQKRAAALPTGAIDETMPRQQLTSNAQAFAASGRLQLIGIVMIPAYRTVTNISVMSGGTAATTPANQWFTLIRVSDKSILAKTVDDTTTAWGTNAVKTLALSSTYTATEDTLAYIGACVVAAATPTMTGMTGLSTPLGLTPPTSGLGPASLTDPASFASISSITANATQAYGYIS